MIRINDKWDVPWQAGMTVDDVLTVCKFTHHHIVISVNDTLVPPDEYATQPVVNGSQVWAIHVVAGG